MGQGKVAEKTGRALRAMTVTSLWISVIFSTLSLLFSFPANHIYSSVQKKKKDNQMWLKTRGHLKTPFWADLLLHFKSVLKKLFKTVQIKPGFTSWQKHLSLKQLNFLLHYNHKLKHIILGIYTIDQSNELESAPLLWSNTYRAHLGCSLN